MEPNPWEFIKKFRVPLLIIGSGIVVYFNAFFNGFVWDDNGYIINNTSLHTFSLSTIFGNSSINGSGYFYRPINAFTLSLLYALFNAQPFFYHVIQITLHIGNSFLIFLLFKELFVEEVALFLAGVFLVHPMQVESVGYISTIASPLASFFGLSALVLGKNKRISIKRQAIIASLMLLALLTKEDGLIYIFFLTVFTYLFRKTYFRQMFLSLAGVFCFYVLVRLVTGSLHPIAFFNSGQAVHISHNYAPIMRLSFVERMLNVPAILFYYLSTFIFPSALSVDQLWVITRPTLWNFFIPFFLDILFFLTLITGGISLFLFEKKKFYIYLLFSLLFLTGIGLYLQLLPLDMTVADRWFYVPVIGLLGMIGVVLELLITKVKLHKVFITVGILLIVVLSVRTMFRNTDFQNETTLFAHDMLVRDNYDLEMNLGADLFEAGKNNEALEHLKRSIVLFPSEVNLYNLAYVYEQVGDIYQAEYYYTKALSYPSYTQGTHMHTEGTYINLVKVLLIENKTNKASSVIKQGLAEYPSSFPLHFYQVIIYYKEGKNSQAVLLAKQLYQATNNSNALMLYNSIISKEKIQIPEGKQEVIIAP